MNIKNYYNVSQKLTVCIENEEKEDIVIIFADPSVKVIQIQKIKCLFSQNESTIV